MKWSRILLSRTLSLNSSCLNTSLLTVSKRVFATTTRVFSPVRSSCSSSTTPGGKHCWNLSACSGGISSMISICGSRRYEAVAKGHARMSLATNHPAAIPGLTDRRPLGMRLSDSLDAVQQHIQLLPWPHLGQQDIIHHGPRRLIKLPILRLMLLPIIRHVNGPRQVQMLVLASLMLPLDLGRVHARVFV